MIVTFDYLTTATRENGQVKGNFTKVRSVLEGITTSQTTHSGSGGLSCVWLTDRPTHSTTKRTTAMLYGVLFTGYIYTLRYPHTIRDL